MEKATSHPSPFGARLEKLRDQKGFTRESLSDACDAKGNSVSASTIYALEKGGQWRPSPHTVRALADGLGLEGAEAAAFIALRATGGPRRDAYDASRPSLGASPGQTTPFIGRADALATLGAFIRIQQDDPPLLLVRGPSGSGTTRLVEEALTQRGPHAPLTLRGRVPHPVARRPYDPLVGALRRQIRETPRRRRRHDTRGHAWLLALFPDVLTREIDPPRDLFSDTISREEKRALLVTDIAAYLDDIGGFGGTVLVLDNLHWAAPDAVPQLAALTRIIARSPTVSIRIVGICDEGAMQDNALLRQTMGELAAERLAREIPIGPLTRDESVTLLQEVAPRLDGIADRGRDRGRDRILEQSGGIPLHLVAYGQALTAGAVAYIPSTGYTIADLVRRRIRDGDDVQTDVLDALAVYGWPAPSSVVAALVEQTDGEVADALVALVDAGLLMEDDDGYCFAHETMRQAVLATIASIQRLALHVRCARVVTALADPALADLRAYHAEEAPAGDVLHDTIARADRLSAIDAARARAAAMFADTSSATYDRRRVAFGGEPRLLDDDIAEEFGL